MGGAVAKAWPPPGPRRGVIKPTARPQRRRRRSPPAVWPGDRCPRGRAESPTRSLKLVRAVVLEVRDVDRALRVIDRDSGRHAQRWQTAARHVPLVDERARSIVYHDAGVDAAAPASHVDAARVIHGERDRIEELTDALALAPPRRQLCAVAIQPDDLRPVGAVLSGDSVNVAVRVDGDLAPAVERRRLRPARDERAGGTEAIHAPGVHDDLAGSHRRDRRGGERAAQLVVAKLAPLPEETTIGRELLDPMVTPIRDVHRVADDRDGVRELELAVGAPERPPRRERLEAAAILHDPMVVGVGDVDVAPRVDGHAAGPPQPHLTR